MRPPSLPPPFPSLLPSTGEREKKGRKKGLSSSRRMRRRRPYLELKPHFGSWKKKELEKPLLLLLVIWSLKKG